MSQALVYNGNRQERHAFHTPLHFKRIIPERQADVGWDTLNWKELTRPYELVATTRRGGLVPESPDIEVNWQTKLVPMSVKLLERARSRLSDPYRSILEPIDVTNFTLHTH